MIKTLNFSLLLSMATTLLLSTETYARSALMITTQRIVLDGRERSASVHLKNNGDSRGRYKVFFREKKMAANGTVQSMKDGEAAPWSAAHMVRFSPRRVSLEARQSQRVRLAIRKPADLPDGEYRSHLVFKGAPENQLDPNNSSKLQFTPTFEFSIPVIIRHGKTFAGAELSHPSLQKNGKQQQIELTMHRTGNRSLFGDIKVFGLNKQSEKGIFLFEQRGFAHYTPSTERKVFIQIPDNVDIRQHGLLKVVFQERPRYGGNEQAELVFAHR